MLAVLETAGEQAAAKGGAFVIQNIHDLAKVFLVYRHELPLDETCPVISSSYPSKHLAHKDLHLAAIKPRVTGCA